MTTINTKNYEAVSAALTKLDSQLTTEVKLDPRLKRGLARVKRLLALTEVAKKRYEIVCNRKVPSKIAAKKTSAKPAKKPAKKAKTKTTKKTTVEVRAAAASRKVAVKRSK